ncbi:lactate permease [Vibrio parahaemolyticus]|nr:lactate permease [Vibrio parahaemolyticus]
MYRQDRFKKRQAFREKRKQQPRLFKAASPELVVRLLDSEVDNARLNSFDYIANLDCPIEADPAEAQALLLEMRNAFEQQRVNDVLGKAQRDVLQSIAGPFGLGKMLSAYDKIGGNVDTIHNARQGVYATEKAQQNYEQKDDYDPHAVHSHTTYTDHNQRNSTARKTVGIEDGYSGDTLGYHDKTDLEHVISGKQTHDDPGRVLAEIPTEELANQDENLIATSASINRSKKAKSPEEFANYLEETSGQRKDRINQLNHKGNLTDKELKELAKLEQLEKADPDKVRSKGEQAKKAQDSAINKEYYSSKKFRSDVVSSGAKEGIKMGAQQAFGTLLMELFSATFDELRELYRMGLEGPSLFADAKVRLKRISQRVAAKWKDAIAGFSGGFISGFISNFVTVIINAFVTTGKRAVRMIREGIFSLLKAVKTLLFPQEGLSYREAAHEAMKLVASGGIVVVGVAAEEVIETFILSVHLLTPIAGMLTAVLVGALSAIGISLVCYLLDRVDLFGAIDIQCSKFVLRKLDQETQLRIARCDEIANEVEQYLETTPLLA